MRNTCTATRLIDDEKTTVTRFDFAQDEETGWHEHGYDYVITAITDCHMRLEHPDGSETEAHVRAGEAYRRTAGIRHNVINASDQKMSFVEIELKK
jgi:quercetin dioxygenase-like cupin family protein